ncbi:S-adenosyl-L-methionine-dependent methyltransferase [Pseudoneurospora amorphoporcata]|uniref:S-adenosyl-L-methionine-dependent methyltransferase n=1 Tax=Pseudoneurospora amorphoporcata TaxID=241081 RepID=A0AAN6NV75_9PEZI|nr:S-adenosyl-L-methionine-dependent methyltransferase [Pseudoneurospora amorphoporcata]
MVDSPKAKGPTPASASPPAAGGPPVPISGPLTAGEAGILGILPTSHWQQVQAEDAADDTDDTASTIGSITSSTTSLSRSIFEYRKNVSQRPMDLFHHLNTLVLSGKLYLAPLPKNIQKAVGIGTGTGIWAIDFADEFPDTEVIGTGVSPIQPTWVPANVKFEIDDVNREWPWPDNTFDYIHSRSLIGVVQDWKEYYRQAFRCLKPGGFVEDDTNSAKVFSEDRTEDIHRKCMEKAGFVDITKDIKVPVGAWPQDKTQKELGICAKMALESDLEGYVNYIWGVVLGWTPEEIATYCAAFRRELKNKTIHGMYTTRVAYGRKPE